MILDSSLEGPLVVDTVDDDEPVGDAMPMAGNLPGTARAGGGGGEGGRVCVETLGVDEPDALPGAPVGVHVGYVDVFNGRVKRL